MASYNELLALIDAYINQNGVQAITGQVLNGVLRAMVDQLGRGYSIMGAADPTTDPGTPDGPETWFASVPGTYTNFDGIQIVDGELALLSYTPSTGFSKNTIYEGFQTVQATIDGNVGTPSVGVSYANGILSFDFHNMKGVTGDPAGFGAVTASVDSNIGTPSVQVQTSGPDTAKAIAFQFHNLKGETGVTSVLATVDNTSGNPQCAVSLNGQQLVLNFTGLKGAQGDTGSSVDYPFTIVNNLTTDDATQALSAAQGVVLAGQVSQLEHKVDGAGLYESPETFDITQLGKKSYSMGATGTFGTNSNYKHSLMPVFAGEVYEVSANSTNDAYIAWWTEWKAAKSGDSAPLVAGTARITVPANTTQRFIAPATATYMYIYAGLSPFDYLPSSVKHIPVSYREDVKGLDDATNISAWVKTLQYFQTGLRALSTITSVSDQAFIIPVKANKTYKVEGSASASTTWRYGFSSVYPIVGGTLTGTASATGATFNYLYTPTADGYLLVTGAASSSTVQAYIDNTSTVGGTVNNLLGVVNYLPIESYSNDWKIYDADGNEGESLLGKPNVRYSITVPNDKKILHIRFKFKLTQPLDELGNSHENNICIVGSTSNYRASLRQQPPAIDSGNSSILVRSQSFLVMQGGNYDSGGKNNVAARMMGDTPAYILQYKGEDFAGVNGYKISLASNAVSIIDTNNATVETISVDTDELLASVIDKINSQSDYLTATALEVAGLKYTDCLLYNAIPLVVGNSGYRPWLIYKLQDDLWHHYEAVLDFNQLMSWTNLDGITEQIAVTEPTNKTVYIGGVSSGTTYPLVPIQVKDIHIGFDYEDAEIIEQPYNTDSSQFFTRLISNDSPYLIIFEGHGVEDKRDDQAHGNNMSASTDRLRTVLAALDAKGYVPVTWRDVILWKKYQGGLPKRCYTFMFDDFRIENYMDVKLREPFTQYNAFPGLAIISNRDRSETVTIDGKTWTLGEVFDAIVKGGWYPTSHTYNHTVINDILEMNLLSFLKECVYSCDKLGIYDDVLVYPQGSVSWHKKQLCRISGFKIGVQVSVDRYNAIGKVEFDLVRTEIGVRRSIANVLGQIV